MAKIQKMDLTSASGASINLEALYQICPSCFTEVKDEKTGKIEHKINFKTLRELLGDNAYEEADEEYGFNWVGKRAAIQEAGRPTNKTLRPYPNSNESEQWETTGNLYIEGDNLEVLKLLQKSYLGAIKMIYIDPPYNTGKDFVYRDEFSMNSEEFDNETGNVDELGNRFRINTDSNLRFHSVWCSMIYERLTIARNLLTKDGVILISIDDHEINNLLTICDEIFFPQNRLITTIINRTSEVATDKTVQKHEYCVIYARDINSLEMCGKSNETISRGTVGNLDQTMPEITFPKGLSCLNIPDGIYHSSRQIEGSRENIQVITPFIVTNGKLAEDVVLKARWRSSNDMRNFFNNGCRPTRAKINGIITEIFFDGDRLMPYIKKTVTEKIPSLYLENNRGSSYLTAIDLNYFDFPKSVKTIGYLISLFTSFDDIILDFFSGSATTAHAIMQLNAEDGCSRKFIMVQIPEETPVKSEARKAGFTNICEIGKERIRRAGQKIKTEYPEAKSLDTGFRVLKLDESNMEDVYFAPAHLTQDQIVGLIDNVKSGRTDLDLLFGCMLNWGMELSLPIEEIVVDGKSIYDVNEGELLACFEHDINEEVINKVADLNPLRVVFRDNGFNDAPLKINLFEIFKQRCDWTEEMVSNRVRII